MARNKKNESRNQWFTKQAIQKKKSKPRNCFRRFNKTDRPMARLIKRKR